MGRYLIRRLLQAVPVLLFITILSFMIMHLAPGDPVAYYINPDRHATSPEQLAELRSMLGLDKPIYVQYVGWLKNMVTGNWGYSLKTKNAVKYEVLSRLPNTLLLSGAAMLLALVIAIPLGTISALKRYSIFDYVATVAAFMGASIPSFWLGMVLVQLISNVLGVLPSVGMHTLGKELSTTGTIIDVARHLVLPAIVLSMVQVASWTRYQRSSLLDVLNQDYIRTARAKGLREKVVVLRHALKNSLIPVITLLGLTIPALVDGAFVIETVFAWPGMGRLGVTSIIGRDYPVVMAVTMLSSLMVVGGNLLADIAYGFVDPRVRYS